MATSEGKKERERLRNKISSAETRLTSRIEDVQDQVECLKLKCNAIELSHAVSRVIKSKSKSMAKVRKELLASLPEDLQQEAQAMNIEQLI